MLLPNKLFHLEYLSACGRWINHPRARFPKLFKHLNAQKTIDWCFQKCLPVAIPWDIHPGGLGSLVLFITLLGLLLGKASKAKKRPPYINMVHSQCQRLVGLLRTFPSPLPWVVLTAVFNSARIVKIHILSRLCCVQLNMCGLF